MYRLISIALTLAILGLGTTLVRADDTDIPRLIEKLSKERPRVHVREQALEAVVKAGVRNPFSIRRDFR